MANYRVIITDETSNMVEITFGDCVEEALNRALKRFIPYNELKPCERIRAWLNAQISTRAVLTTIKKSGNDYSDFVSYVIEQHEERPTKTVFCELSAHKIDD